MRTYKYDMGFEINGTDIPDPAGFGGETASLDLSAERDTNGLLHRDMVAIKVPLEIRYVNIGWTKLNAILALVAAASFSFTFPDPNTGALRTGTYYAGNRKWEVVRCPNGTLDEDCICTLTFSVIEY